MEETETISVVRPISEAMDWMQDRLFDPFEVGEWFVFGFAWFLASLAQFQSGFNFSGGGDFGGGAQDGFEGGGTGSEGVFEEIMSNLTPTVIAMIIVGFIVGFAIYALFSWLGSRGSFIFLDCTLSDTAAISEPWSEYSTLGNSLFKVRLMLMVIGVCVGLLLFGGTFLVGLTIGIDEIGGGIATLLIVIGVLFGLIFSIVFVVLHQMLSDFVVQIMYQRDMYCWEACQLFWSELLSRHPGTFLMFYLMKFVLSLAAGVLMAIGACLTCCIGILPYLSNVIFLPIGVFFRTYSIRMLAQFGNEWRLEPMNDEVAKLF